MVPLAQELQFVRSGIQWNTFEPPAKKICVREFDVRGIQQQLAVTLHANEANFHGCGPLERHHVTRHRQRLSTIGADRKPHGRKRRLPQRLIILRQPCLEKPARFHMVETRLARTGGS